MENTEMNLSKRYFYGNNGYYNSSWYNWGRWVVLAAVVLSVIFVFFLCSCVTARRRRRNGLQPFYGTGWAAGQHGTPQYYPNGAGNTQYNTYGASTYNPNAYQQNTSNDVPPYSPPSNAGYYGQQQYGVELSSPQGAYVPPTRANEYAPPSGPPPGKA